MSVLRRPDSLNKLKRYINYKSIWADNGCIALLNFLIDISGNIENYVVVAVKKLC